MCSCVYFIHISLLWVFCDVYTLRKVEFLNVHEYAWCAYICVEYLCVCGRLCLPMCKHVCVHGPLCGQYVWVLLCMSVWMLLGVMAWVWEKAEVPPQQLVSAFTASVLGLWPPTPLPGSHTHYQRPLMALISSPSAGHSAPVACKRSH